MRRRRQHGDEATLRAVEAAAQPLDGPVGEAALLELVGDARLVLLGEASHGTAEFYAERARMTRLLVERAGFRGVAIEGDWPDADRLDRYVRGRGIDDVDEGLAGFERFPRWMWRNEEVRAFALALRAWNDGRPAHARVAVHGLDLYSLAGSIEAVVRYLDEVDPEAAARARRRYACFDHVDRDSQAYGLATSAGAEPCKDAVVEQLVELRGRAAAELDHGARDAADAVFSAEQNARLVRNAERYYRTMFHGRVESWNLRDTHMAETLAAIQRHLATVDGPGRVVVWAHNSHVGDARATELGDAGELTLGQLARKRCGAEAVLIGFTTATGTVRAAHDWGGPDEVLDVRPPQPGAYEDLLSRVGRRRFLLPLREGEAADALRPRRLERAIGVIYRPHTERWSHLFSASLPDQFDAVVHLDRTRAVVPLAPIPPAPGHDLPETFPSAV